MDAKIYLFTGRPGQGKTLFACDFLDNNKDFHGRPIYYYNFNNLKFNWVKLTEEQIKNWFEFLPENSVLFVDEAQDVWPPIGQKDRPLLYSQLNKHRHRGIDIVLVTQEPMLIDSKIRPLVAVHYHYLKHPNYLPWIKKSRQFRFDGCCQTPQNESNLKRADLVHRNHPTQYFGYYKSSSGTSRKTFASAKFYAAVLFILIAIPFLYFSINSLIPTDDGAISPIPPPEDKTPTKIPTVDSVLTSLDSSSFSNPSAYISPHPSMPWAASIYSEAYEVKHVPEIACNYFIYYDSDKKINYEQSICDCFTQQRTRVHVDFDTCVNISDNGIFQPHLTIADNDRSEKNKKTE